MKQHARPEHEAGQSPRSDRAVDFAPSGPRPTPLSVRLLVPFLTTTSVALVTSVAMIGPLLELLSRQFHITVGQAGQLGTATALPWAITALLAGPVVDRHGPRAVLGVSLLGLGLATCMCAIAPSFGALLFLRAAAGIVGGAAPAAVNTIIAESVPAPRRGRAIGWVYSGFPLAAVAGVPAAGTLAGVAGWRSPFTVVGVALCALAVAVWLWLGPDARRAASAPVRGVPQLRALAADRMWLLVLANALERVAYAACAFYLATFLMNAYGLDTVAVALPLALAAGGALLGNVLGGQLADHGNRAIIFAAMMVVAAGFGAAVFLVELDAAITATLGSMFGLANAASRPAFMAVATSVSPQHRATTLGVISSTSQVGWALGAALGGLAYEVAGAPGLAALVGGASLAGAAAMLPLRRAQAAEHAPSDSGAHR